MRQSTRQRCIFLPVILLCLAFWPPLSRSEDPGTDGRSPFRFDFSHRFRFVSWDNAVHLDEAARSESTFTRHRTSLSAAFVPSPEFELHLKVSNEFRIYFVPEGRDFNIHEFFVDNLFLRSTRPGNLPLRLTLGRQDIMLGEGFVVMDGHPLDGSRSIYFNAARADVFLADEQKLTLFYTYQPVTDNILPVVNDREQPLIEQPEEGIGLYYSGKLGRSGLEAHLIRKNIRSTKERATESGINTIGVRLSSPLTERLSVTAEGAFQGGNEGPFSRSASGGYGHIDFRPGAKFPAPDVVTLGAIWLSGDDPSTDRQEGWDPLFSRWPKWSESYIYTLIPEYQGRVAYWSNLGSLHGTLQFQVTRSSELIFSYYRLWAPRRPDEPSAFPGGSGRVRGGLFIAKFNFLISASLTGHVLWETFSPGDYYRSDADGFHWIRVELLYRL